MMFPSAATDAISQSSLMDTSTRGGRGHEHSQKNTVDVQGTTVSFVSRGNEDFISLTDIAKYKNPDHADDVIRNWLRNRNTIEFLGIWERLNNPDFNPVEFDGIKFQAGLNSFTLTPKQWIEKTEAIRDCLASRTATAARMPTRTSPSSSPPGSPLSSGSTSSRSSSASRRTKTADSRSHGTSTAPSSKLNYRIHTDAIRDASYPARSHAGAGQPSPTPPKPTFSTSALFGQTGETVARRQSQARRQHARPRHRGAAARASQHRGHERRVHPHEPSAVRPPETSQPDRHSSDGNAHSRPLRPLPGRIEKEGSWRVTTIDNKAQQRSAKAATVLSVFCQPTTQEIKGMMDNNQVLYATLPRRIKASIADGIQALLALNLHFFFPDYRYSGRKGHWVKCNGDVHSRFLKLEPFLISFLGFTLGQYIFGIQVVRLGNRWEKCPLISSFARYFTKTILGSLSIAYMLFSKKHQAIHDHFAKTLVVLSHKKIEQNPEFAQYGEIEQDLENDVAFTYPSVARRFGFFCIWVVVMSIVFGILVEGAAILLLPGYSFETEKMPNQIEVASNVLYSIIFIGLAVLASKDISPGAKRKIKELDNKSLPE